MDKKTIIYNFGPDGRDACWAALTSSWTHFSKQQGLNTTQVSCDSSACNDVEAQFKDTTRTLNSWPVKSRGRPNKKKKQNFLTTTTTSLSPPPRPLPPSSPRALKRPSGVLQQRWVSANDQLSSSVGVVKQKISEPPKTNGPCNCSQSVNSELSGVIVTGNNNNNNDDDVVDNDKNKYGAMETIKFADRKQQQLMLCAADSPTLWTDVNEPVVVDAAEQPTEVPNEDDHVSSVSRPPTHPAAAVVEQAIEHARQIESHRVASTEFRRPTPFAVIEQSPIERALPNGDDDHDVSADSRSPTPFDVIEQPIERALPNEDDDHDVSADSRSPTPFAVIEQPIERALPNGDDDHGVSADLRPPTPSAVAENPTMMEVAVSYREVVSPTFRPQLSLMTSTTDADNPTAIIVVSPSSSQPQPNDGKDCPVQSNSSMIVFSEKPLSKYEMKIKEIDNNIISYSKSFLSTVLFVVLLRVLF